MKPIEKKSDTVLKDYAGDFLQAVKNNNTQEGLNILEKYGSSKGFYLAKDTNRYHCGWTALHFAVYHNKLILIKAIVDKFPER